MAQAPQPASPARYPRFWDDYARHRQERDYPLGIAFPGPFTALRDWVGPSGLARALAGDRAWVEEMVEYLSEFGVAASARALRDLPLDFAIIRERAPPSELAGHGQRHGEVPQALLPAESRAGERASRCAW